MHTAASIPTNPFDLLPTEVISGLFVIAVESKHDGDLSTPLSHVCRQWRSIALDTPDLWCKVVFDENSYKVGPDFSKQIEWLKRSQEAPLTIEFRRLSIFLHSRWKYQHTVTAEMMNVITPHARRWQQLNGRSCSWSGLYEKILSNMNGLDTPNLESVLLNGESTDNRWSHVEHRFGSTLRPKLKSLSMAAVTCTSSSFTWTPQLKYLSMGSHGGGLTDSMSQRAARKILSVLYIASGLRELEVVIYIMLWHPERDQDQHRSFPDSFTSDLECLHLQKRPYPNDGGPPAPSAPCLHIVCEKLPRLKVIKFSGIPMSEDSQLDALGIYCPELEEIHLSDCSVNDGEEVLDRILVSRMSAGFGPLQLLEITECRGFREPTIVRKKEWEAFVAELRFKPADLSRIGMPCMPYMPYD